MYGIVGASLPLFYLSIKSRFNGQCKPYRCVC